MNYGCHCGLDPQSPYQSLEANKKNAISIKMTFCRKSTDTIRELNAFFLSHLITNILSCMGIYTQSLIPLVAWICNIFLTLFP